MSWARLFFLRSPSQRSQIANWAKNSLHAVMWWSVSCPASLFQHPSLRPRTGITVFLCKGSKPRLLQHSPAAPGGRACSRRPPSDAIRLDEVALAVTCGGKGMTYANPALTNRSQLIPPLLFASGATPRCYFYPVTHAVTHSSCFFIYLFL